MANRRTLKKEINALVFDIIDECLYLQEHHDDKVHDAEALIEEVVMVYNELIERINKGKNKADFSSVRNEFYEKSELFSEKLNAISV
ncbi:MAG: hypothetical protein EBR54_07380 [Flavobacteriia bacterium]|nr:hypothetical protein [Flavobacteriia bacterium]NBX39215.1 hypothetical protein [Flavobacteriia bacterium]